MDSERRTVVTIPHFSIFESISCNFVTFNGQRIPIGRNLGAYSNFWTDISRVAGRVAHLFD
jgi:hypothetical protein